MTEWKTYRAEDYCLTVTDGTHDSPKPQAEGRYLITSKHLKPSGIDFSSANKICEEDYQKIIQRSRVEQYDILFSMIGTVGNIHRVTIPIVDFAVKNMGIFKMGGDANKSLWMYYWLQSPIAQEYIQSRITGSTQGYLTLGNLRDFPVCVPSLEEQRRIAGILGAIDDKIENNRRINTNLELQAQALFDEWFITNTSRLGVFSKAYLTDIANYLNGLAMQRFRLLEGEIGIPVLKIKELGQGQCDSSSDLCSPSIEEKYIVRDGDIIFSWSGTLLVDIWCGGVCGLNQHLFKVTSDKYPQWFIYYWTKHHLAKFIRIAKDKAVTMGHIKRGDLEVSEVLIPDEKSFAEMDKMMSPIFKAIVVNRIENRRLATLRDTLLPKLMNGEIKI